MIQNKSLARQQRITKLISSTSGPKSRPWLLLLAFAHVIRDLSLFFHIFFVKLHLDNTVSSIVALKRLRSSWHWHSSTSFFYSRRRNILTNEKKEKKKKICQPFLQLLRLSNLKELFFSRENFYEKQIINARNLLN